MENNQNEKETIRFTDEPDGSCGIRTTEILD